MKESTASTTTRTSLLRRGTLLIGAALGLGAARAEARPMPATAAPGSAKFTLHGRAWRIQAPGRQTGRPLGRGEQANIFGELHSRQAGKKVGEFYSTRVATLAPFGATPFAAGGIEMHTFNLGDGSIIGMGSHFGLAGTYAIVGGTGRYHGARGSYSANQSPLGLGGDGTAEFNFDLIA